MRYIGTLLTFCILSACSGGSSDQYGPECGAASSCAPPELTPAASIVGLWDSSVVGSEDSLNSYTQITESGGYNKFIYQQGDGGIGENCYLLTAGRIWRYTDSSRYEIESSDDPEFSLQRFDAYREGEVLRVVGDSDSVELWPEVLEFTVNELVLCQ